ncbi:restriction endonuclease subunit S [Streptomyces sp. NPDC005329]|uniref:restriction endonuclease subunit S n=1 Tax=Streptomyces sp. NPDC005329 TaxID=3157034 RepID=UPI0033BD04F8
MGDEQELPAGWAWAALGEVADTALGKMLDKKQSTGRYPTPYLRNVNVQWGQIDTDDLLSMDIEPEDLSRFVVSKGDLVVCEGGEIGRCAIWNKDESIAFQKALHRVRPSRVMDNRYLRYYLEYAATSGKLSRFSTGSTIKHIPQQRLREVPIPVPPLAEQHRIVEAVEEQLSRLEVALKSLAASVVRSVTLRRALVVRAFTGALLPNRGDIHLAKPLLERVDAQVSEQAGKKRWSQQRTPAQEWCRDLPEGWEWRTLGSLSVLIQYGTSAKAEATVTGDAVPVIRMGNIQSGSIVMNDVKYLPAGHPDIESMRLRDGDLLFNRTNSAELVGKSAVYRDGLGGATFASYLIRCRLANGIDPDWVNAYVNSPDGRKYIRSVLSQQVGQANVNSAKLAMFPIPVPSVEEQGKIMENLREWSRLLEHSDEGRKAAEMRAARLRESLLRAAFGGTLTQQSSDDEPAASSLARIASERAAQAEPERTRKAMAKKAGVLRSAAPSGEAPEPTPAPALAVQQEFDL